MQSYTHRQVVPDEPLDGGSGALETDDDFPLPITYQAVKFWAGLAPRPTDPDIPETLVCGDTVEFTANYDARGATPDEYEWSFVDPDTSIAWGNPSTLTDDVPEANVTLTCTGEYKGTVIVKDGAAESPPFEFTVEIDFPSISSWNGSYSPLEVHASQDYGADADNNSMATMALIPGNASHQDYANDIAIISHSENGGGNDIIRIRIYDLTDSPPTLELDTSVFATVSDPDPLDLDISANDSGLLFTMIDGNTNDAYAQLMKYAGLSSTPLQDTGYSEHQVRGIFRTSSQDQYALAYYRRDSSGDTSRECRVIRGTATWNSGLTPPSFGGTDTDDLGGSVDEGDWPSVGVVGGDRVLVAYVDNANDDLVVCREATAGAASFDSPDILLDNAAGTVFETSVHLLGDRVGLAYRNGVGDASLEFMVTNSEVSDPDASNDWLAPIEVVAGAAFNPQGYNPDLKYLDGAPYIAFQGLGSSGLALKLARACAGGCFEEPSGWSVITLADSTYGTGYHPTVVMYSTDKLAVAYHNQVDNDGNGNVLVRFGATWE